MVGKLITVIEPVVPSTTGSNRLEDEDCHDVYNAVTVLGAWTEVDMRPVCGFINRRTIFKRKVSSK